MHPIDSSASPPSPSLTDAFWYWLKLGCISFGGPTGQIALMHAELVDKRRWISERRFLHALNYCMLLPGPEATQLAIYIGWLMHRIPGGILAGTLFVLPSLLLLIALSWMYVAFNNVPMVVGVMYGIKPAVVAIVLSAAWRIGSHTLQNQWRIGIAAAAFLAITLLHVPFPIIVLSAACLGCIGAYITPDILKMKEGHAAVSASNAAFIIDDHTPTPDHARYTLRKLIVISVAGICLGLAPWLVLTMHYGASSTFPQMSTFFTKAAFLTFGGAYAVLPYVYQGAVEHYHWLTPSQMMDGLALGETTPGPLIMIVTFVGFVGGWTKMATLTAGIMGACVATYFTFLPSFIFILAGGPMVESTRDNLRLTFPLTTISAAVVGVILSLVVFFAKHIFNLTAPISQWDWIAIAATAAACVALFKFKLQPMKLILISAVIGLVVSYLR